MAKAASHQDLKDAFTEHLEVTRGQVTRLDEIFEELEESPKGKEVQGDGRIGRRRQRGNW